MLLCNETVTLVRHRALRSGDAYTCTVIVGASWFAKTAVKPEDGGIAAANVVKIRIPAANMPEEVTPCAKDYFVRGVVANVSSLDDLKKHEYIKAQAVGDNRRGRLSHWAVTGS